MGQLMKESCALLEAKSESISTPRLLPGFLPAGSIPKALLGKRYTARGDGESNVSNLIRGVHI